MVIVMEQSALSARGRVCIPMLPSMPSVGMN